MGETGGGGRWLSRVEDRAVPGKLGVGSVATEQAGANFQPPTNYSLQDRSTTHSTPHHPPPPTTTMDARSLHETGQQILKAFNGAAPPETLLNLLKPLEGWKAEETALRTSKIGVTVNKLRHAKDPRVAAQAIALVSKWKKELTRVPRASSPAHASSSHANGAHARASAPGSPAPRNPSAAAAAAAAAAPATFTVAPDKRTAKADAVDTAVTGDATRDACVQLIYNGLCFTSAASPADVLGAARRVEAAAFDVHQDTTPVYRQKMRSLFSNLKMKENKALRERVFSGALPADVFVRMTSEELKSDEKRKRDEEMEKENMNKAMTAEEEKAISTTYVSHNPSAQTCH